MPRGIANVKPAEVEPEVAEVEAAEEVEVEPEEVEVEAPEVATERREVFEATRPDGTVVVVDRNIDTGEQTVSDK